MAAEKPVECFESMEPEGCGGEGDWENIPFLNTAKGLKSPGGRGGIIILKTARGLNPHEDHHGCNFIKENDLDYLLGWMEGGGTFHFKYYQGSQPT